MSDRVRVRVRVNGEWKAWSTDELPVDWMLAKGADRIVIEAASPLPDDGLREALERLTEKLERECFPLAEDPENSIDYNEGICDERGRIAGILDSLLSPEAALATPSAQPGWEPFVEFGDGERISASVAVDRLRRPFGPICGMVVEGGPNGEPLACAYPPNPPGERMHAHSWSTLPTFSAATPSAQPEGLDPYASRRFAGSRPPEEADAAHEHGPACLDCVALSRATVMAFAVEAGLATGPDDADDVVRSIASRLSASPEPVSPSEDEK